MVSDFEIRNPLRSGLAGRIQRHFHAEGKAIVGAGVPQARNGQRGQCKREERKIERTHTPSRKRSVLVAVLFNDDDIGQNGSGKNAA